MPGTADAGRQGLMLRLFFPRILLLISMAVAAIGLGLGLPALASHEPRIIRPTTDEAVTIGGSLDILEDPTTHMTLADVLAPDAQNRFTPSPSDWPSFGVSTGAVWMRVRVDLTEDPTRLHRRLQFNALHPDTADLYIVDDTGRLLREFKGGMLRPGSFTHRKLTLPLSGIEPPVFTVYARITTVYVSTLTLVLISAEEDTRAELAMERVLGPLFGAMVLATVFCLLLLIYLRERLYAFGFGFTVAIFIATQGYINADRLYWPDVLLQPAVNRAVYFISIGLLPVFGLLFSSHFLHIPRLMPSMHRVAWALASIIVVAYFAAYVIWPHAFIYLHGATVVMSVVTMALMLTVALRHNIPDAWMYLILALPAAGFIAVANIASLGLLQRHPVLTSGTIAGMTILSCGIAVALAAGFSRRLEATVRERTRALSSAIEALTETHDAKNRMLGVVAHDLRNPLSAIKSAVELLLLPVQLSGERRESLLKSIRDGAALSLSMSEDLLDAAAIEEGTVRLMPEACDLNALVHSRLELFRLAATPKGVDIKLDTTPTPPVWADPKRLGQALDNLLSNAVKYSPPGGEVLVSLHAHDGRAHLSIADRGAGIPADEINRIFKPFERASTKPTGGERSTGLGLAIVKRLIEAQGGHVTVHSTPGEGSRFEVFLPLAAGAPV